MPRVLLLATTTGYQTRAFGDAARRLGVQLAYATDRCHLLDDPWQDEAIPIRFYEEAAAADAIVAAAADRPIDGLITVGDRPTTIAARVAARLGLPGHPVEAAAIARDKERTRQCVRDAGLPAPWFIPTPLDADPREVAARVTYPCVVKPVALSASRGVMRANTRDEFLAAFDRLRTLVRLPDLRAERNDAHARALVEGFIPGREFAVEGLLNHGRLTALAIFDKPDPLDGPFFEETIYVTPPALAADARRQVVETVGRAAAAIGLHHGPIHVECRVNRDGVFVLEVAARPIGGLCARALSFEPRGDSVRAGEFQDRRDQSAPAPCSLEELLLRHALGESPDGWTRESCASGVMMIPIPARGVYRGVSGLDEARQVPGVDEVTITAKAHQVLVPPPEGASYLGFVFARGESGASVERALRTAHAHLRFAIETELPVNRA